MADKKIKVEAEVTTKKNVFSGIGKGFGITICIFLGIIFLFVGCVALFSYSLDRPQQVVPPVVVEEVNKTDTIQEVKQTEPKKPKLEIISHNDKTERAYLYITGEVKNNGNTIAKSVKVTAKFYKDGNFIDRDYTYVDESDIPAGQIDTFEIMWQKQDYDRYELLVS